MDKQTVQFAVQSKDGVIARIGRSCVPHPEIRFSGGSIRWYQDRPKQHYGSKNG